MIATFRLQGFIGVIVVGALLSSLSRLLTLRVLLICIGKSVNALNSGIPKQRRDAGETPTPANFNPEAPLWSAAPSRDDFARMPIADRNQTSWPEMAAVASVLQDINHDWIARAVFLAAEEQVDVDNQENPHNPKLKVDPNDPTKAVITLNLFPLHEKPLLLPISFAPGDAGDSKVYWQRALLAAFNQSEVAEMLKTPGFHQIPSDTALGNADRAMAFLEMLTGRAAEKFEVTDTTTAKELEEWLGPSGKDESTQTGGVPLDYNPFILFSEKKLRPVRPVHSYSDSSDDACPITPEEYDKREKEWEQSQKEHGFPSTRSLERQDDEDSNDHTGISARDFISRPYRLLNPATPPRQLFKKIYESICENVFTYGCEAGKPNPCDEFIDLNSDSLKNMKWAIRLKDFEPDTLNIDKIQPPLKALLSK
ncbi:hypothetical protein QFC19_000466 [Naganishia cerealis]|uniref:Uncharacterized protein n=1 Tax=Naganishia cerealis TaxID=610337 RepID=A0ACC2WN76_9TREE|nr:hypothetical protein QFC19_000466 [Naganishia cerealis]